MALNTSSEMRPQWIEAFMAKLLNSIKEKGYKFCDIMEQIGMEENDEEPWLPIVYNEMNELMSQLIIDAADHKNKLLEDIEKLLTECEELCKQLRIKLPDYGDRNLPLYKEKAQLVKIINDYKTELASKKASFDKLQKQEVDLCNQLGKSPKIPVNAPIPTPEEMVEYQLRIDQLETEKFKREEEFITIKYSLMNYAKELSFKPSLEFEKTALSPDDSIFLVTEKNMKKLHRLHNTLKEQYEEVKTNISDLQEKIYNLWQILEEDLSSYENFLQTLPSKAIEKLKVLKAEKKRCEDIKRANTQVFIEKIRNELVELWDKCYFTPEDRQEFLYFDDDLFTEDLLSHHDLELEKVKRYYEENKNLFELLEKRKKLWDKIVQFEDRVYAKDRYKNRGGELLKEEKEKRTINKKLVQIEADLMGLAKLYRERYRKELLINGDTIEETISKAHNEYENMKKDKLSVRKQQKEMTLTPGKSMMSLAGSVQNLARTPLIKTPLPVKRKVGKPLFTEPAKKTKINSENKKLVVPKLLVNNRSRLHDSSRTSMERQRRRSYRVQGVQNQTQTSSEYDDFKNEIGKKMGCRSTLFESNQQTPRLTPRRLNAPQTAPRLTAARRKHLNF